MKHASTLTLLPVILVLASGFCRPLKALGYVQ